MNTRATIALALESAIAAELALFAIYLLSSQRRRTVALYLLAAFSLCIAALVAGNLLIGFAGLDGLGEAILFLDLLAPPLVFLYVKAMHRESRPLVWRDAVHVLPAIAGAALWSTGRLSSMDVYVNACWLAYLVAAIYCFIRQYGAYAPAARQRFLILLLIALVTVWLLRLTIVAQAPMESSFREELPYLLILLAVFALTCLVLLTALRHPDLLTTPGSHVKYGLLPSDQIELDRLSERLAAVFATNHPYLDSDFSLAELAALVSAPTRQVSQAINARHGTNVAAYINRCRAEFAAHRLSDTDKPIKAILFESGFRSKSIFNREFLRCFGMSPSEYRQRNKPRA
jgi:AraC-like DNA-binding protein